MTKFFLVFITLFLIAPIAGAATYYVRTDGSNSTNCTGQANASYDGSGTGEACAYSHPFYWTGRYGDYGNGAGDLTSGTSSGGDELIIVSGTYDVGYDAAWANCNASWKYGCVMKEIPDGTSGTHTRIIGCSSTGCAGTDRTAWPTLTIAEGERMAFNLVNSDYVDVSYIRLTETRTGGRGHSGYSVTNADNDGIRWAGATNITLNYVLIDGFTRYGIYGGDVADVTLNNTWIEYNSFGGWDSDSCSSDGTCGNTGTITITDSKINWSGCVETGTYGTIASGGCYSQSQTGYGDGIGTHNTGGTWVITNSEMNWNTSDGLDLLYCNRGSYSGCTVTVRKSTFEGNTGNQIKGPNYMYVEDSKIVDNCGFFYGQAFTCSSGTCGATFDYCRPGGHGAIVFAFRDSVGHPTFINNTITGNGDVMFLSEGESVCTAGTDAIFYNNLLIGGREFLDDSGLFGGGANDKVSIYYDSSGSCDSDFVENYNYCQGDFKEATPCPAANSTSTTSTTFTSLFNGTILQGPNSSPGYYTGTDYADQLTIKVGAAVINTADESSTVTSLGADSDDFNTFARGASWDIGALEYGSGGSSSSAYTLNTGGIRVTGVVRVN